MSSVLKRFQGISEMEFYNNAQKLSKELSMFVMSDKNVPRKWRHSFSEPIVELLQELFDSFVEANDIWPYSEDLVKDRKAAQQKSIGIVDKIAKRLQFGINVIWWETLHREEGNKERARLENKLELISCLLDREDTLLKGWKKSTKLITRK